MHQDHKYFTAQACLLMTFTLTICEVQTISLMNQNYQILHFNFDETKYGRVNANPVH